MRRLFPALLCLTLLAACGSDTTEPPPAGRGRITGNLSPDAAGASVRLDGTSFAATVNGSGGFSLPDVPPGEYTLSVISPSGECNAVLVRVMPDQVTVVPPLRLQLGGQIAGLVTSLTPSGARALAGARVVARPIPLLYDYAGQAPPGVVEGAGGAAPRQVPDDSQAGPPRYAVTDSDGSYRIAGLPEGPYYVQIGAVAHESAESGAWVSAGSTSVVDAQLLAVDPDNATVVGTVRGELNGSEVPLAGVRVDLWPRFEGPEPVPALGAPEDVIGGTDNAWYIPPFYWAKSTMTDAEGEFSVTNVPPGEYDLTFWRYGYQPITRTITLGMRQTSRQDAVMPFILTTVSGTVYADDQDGRRPLPGATVSAYGYCIMPLPVDSGGGGSDSPEGLPLASADGEDSGGVSIEPWLRGVVTDDQGRYTLEVEAGWVVVNAWADGYNWGYQEAEVGRDGATGVDLVLSPYTEQPPPGGEPGRP